MTMNAYWKHGPLLTLACLTLAGCTATSDYDILKAQVTQHEQALQQLNMQLSGVQPAQADTWSQVQSMRQEIASLRGEVDTMSHAFTQAGGAQAMSDMLARHDRALRLIEAQLAMKLQLDEPAGGLPMAAPGPVSGAPGVPGTAPGAVLPSAPGTVAGSTMVTTPPAGAAGVTPPADASSVDIAQALYDSGYKAFSERRYEQALNAFTDFTKVYGQHKLISNAWFWQGESNYQMERYEAAALAYGRVIESYPNSNKAPGAYLKLGMSFLKLGSKDAARDCLNQLITKYPKAHEATRARQEIKNNKL
ncbi:MAG: tol-pal system protein YbgF [Desulfovibrionaceae bacterium]|nr:tol-pal system protein YbgF [Desulfovibrionaceae bacterium]